MGRIYKKIDYVLPKESTIEKNKKKDIHHEILICQCIYVPNVYTAMSPSQGIRDSIAMIDTKQSYVCSGSSVIDDLKSRITNIILISRWKLINSPMPTQL